MEVLDSVDTEHDMSAETRARIFEPFYTPKHTPECSHVISKIIFSRAQRNRALRQCDQSTSAKCNSKAASPQSGRAPIDAAPAFR
jgi:hypothetical protein